jgi:AGZA family xanthine/uracil permease-like MFS transporter
VIPGHTPNPAPKCIGLGLITYTVMKVFTGKAKDVSILTYVISILFIIKFFAVV